MAYTYCCICSVMLPVAVNIWKGVNAVVVKIISY
jgi:hypothetical protein